MAKDYKPNKKPLIGDVTMNDRTTKVNHPDDHPDVIAQTKAIKKSDKEFKEDSPKMAKVAKALGLFGKEKEKAKKLLATVQARLAKKRTETEGSFAKGGRVNFKGGGCTTKGMNKKAYGKNS